MKMDKYERWYRRRLNNYFDEYYAQYEDYIEWFNDPAVNQWMFYIPELDKTIELTCDDKGHVTEQRYTPPLDTDRAYDILEKTCSKMDAIYEDYILELVGATGFSLLLNKKLLESCGSINGRNLYVLCKK